MDVIVLAQYGIDNVCAALGTAITEQQIALGFKVAAELVFCMDGDRAGRAALQRVVEQALPLLTDGRSIRILLLPEGEDPDSHVRKLGAEEFKQQLARATTLTSYLLQVMEQQSNEPLVSVEGRAARLHYLNPLLNRLPQQ